MKILKNLALLAIVAVIVAAGWMLWQQWRKSPVVDSYRSCVDAGNPVQTSFPEVCVTKDGKRFVSPGQQSLQPPSEGPLPR